MANGAKCPEMSGGIPTGGLSAPQEQCVLALLSETSIRKAAESVGVNEKTVHRWMDEPAFALALRKVRLLSFRQTMGLLQKAAPLAVQVLVKVASDVSAPHSSKVSAATALLKHSRDSIELDDLAARVESLERATKGGS